MRSGKILTDESGVLRNTMQIKSKEIDNMIERKSLPLKMFQVLKILAKSKRRDYSPNYLQ